MPRPRPPYPPEFRAEAVELIRSGRSCPTALGASVESTTRRPICAAAGVWDCIAFGDCHRAAHNAPMRRVRAACDLFGRTAEYLACAGVPVQHTQAAGKFDRL